MAERNISNNINYRDLENKKILVAEDVRLNQDLVKRILESCKMEVTIANNGVEALQYMQENDFDCILMDVQMPEMDGMEATKKIRQLADKTKASVPVIALTANSTDEGNQKYLEAGMNDYLAKPYEEGNLIKVILKNLHQNSITGLGVNDQHTANKTATGLPPADRSKLYNLSMIESVSGGDKEFIKKMILLFIDTVPKDAAQMQQESALQNWIQVGKIAHKLKSTIDSMAIKSIQQDIRTVETNAKQASSLEILPPLIEKIAAVINNCVRQLQSEIA